MSKAAAPNRPSPAPLPNYPPPEHLFYVDVAQAAPRSIPWNCDDWQPSPAVADADDPRVSLILESLAANRGKTIYCAIDQSDTFTKAETWAAGRHRNERDDTVYFGQSGNFRGFLAAQEGYLTDGESGVTGVSRDLIFEFPREERRRRWRTKRWELPSSPEHYILSVGSLGSGQSTASLAATSARDSYDANPPTAEQHLEWAKNGHPDYTYAFNTGADYNAIAGGANGECRRRGWQRATKVRYEITNQPNSWAYIDKSPPGAYQYHAVKFLHFSATCTKRVRR